MNGDADDSARERIALRASVCVCFLFIAVGVNEFQWIARYTVIALNDA